MNVPPFATRLDEWAEQQLERIRGNAAADTVFTDRAASLASSASIWHATNVARRVTGIGTSEQLPVFAVLLGAESLLVNQGIKRLFRRSFLRPRPATSVIPYAGR